MKFIIYANLCKFIRNHKNGFFSFITRPILIWFALYRRANFGTLYFYTEFWNCSPLINYGNLCKFIQKNNKNCFFSLISWPILIWFALSGRAKFGTLNFYTELWDFCSIDYLWYFMQMKWNYVPSRASNFYFLTSSKVYHIKFTIFVVARCGWVLRHWRSGLSYWIALRSGLSYWIALCRRDRRERFPCYAIWRPWLCRINASGKGTSTSDLVSIQRPPIFTRWFLYHCATIPKTYSWKIV